MHVTEHPLRAWRKNRNMSQAELGELIGIGSSQVSQLESGLKGCSVETAIKIKALAGDAVPLESLAARSEVAQ